MDHNLWFKNCTGNRTNLTGNRKFKKSAIYFRPKHWSSLFFIGNCSIWAVISYHWDWVGHWAGQGVRISKFEDFRNSVRSLTVQPVFMVYKFLFYQTCNFRRNICFYFLKWSINSSGCGKVIGLKPSSKRLSPQKIKFPKNKMPKICVQSPEVVMTGE